MGELRSERELAARDGHVNVCDGGRLNSHEALPVRDDRVGDLLDDGYATELVQPRGDHD